MRAPARRVAIAAAVAALAAVPNARARAGDDTGAAAAAAAAPVTSSGSSGDDYRTDNTGWNGTSRLVALIRGLGLDVVAPRRTLWRAFGPDDVVLILYPTHRLDPADLTAFIAGGGRVLVADDFGAAGAALSRLGLVRDGGKDVDASRFYDGLPYAPIARPEAPKHPLADGAPQLVTNHPAIFTDVTGATSVFGFSSDQTVVAAGARGRGRFIALSDPSVLINCMLRFGGNLRFAVNAIRFLSTPRTHRVVLLTGDFALAGEPPEPAPGSGFRGHTLAFLGGFNRWLDGLNDYLVTMPALRIGAVALALIVVILGVAVLPPRRRRPLDGSWTRARTEPGPGEDVDAMVGQFDAADRRANYLVPATVLRDNVNARLGQVVGVPEPLWSIAEAELLRAVGARAGAAASARVRDVYSDLRALPTRVQAASPWQTRRVSRREFERLHSGVAALYRSLEGAG